MDGQSAEAEIEIGSTLGRLAVALLDPYTGPWTSVQAAHLARRTTFGAIPQGIAALTTAGVSAAVDSIVNYSPTDQPLENLIGSLPSGNGTSDFDRIKNPVAAPHLEGWWLFRMVHSTQPFQQQFALFLHDHFTSEWSKIETAVPSEVNNGNDGSIPGQACLVTSGGLPPDPNRRGAIVARLLRDQHYLFLTKGHGSFREMMIAITRDPCMLIYLDNRLNLKVRPQENYAREMMELFSMGVGNYTEQDVREVARALTGETLRTACLLNWPYIYVYITTSHDTNPKTVFGVTFNNVADGADTIQCIDLALDRVSGSTVSPRHSVYPAASLYLSWKFIRWFVNESIEIGHDAVGELADFFYNNTAGGFRYNVRETLRKLFKSQFFYDPAHRYKIIRNPADFMITALRSLELDDPDYTGAASNFLRGMGMQLFEPPTVNGWPQGRPWINSSGLVARFNYANRLSSNSVLSDAAIDALITTGQISGFDDDAGIMNYFASRLLLDTLTAQEAAVFTQLFNEIKGSATTTTTTIYRKKVRAALHLTMTMPRYQLK